MKLNLFTNRLLATLAMGLAAAGARADDVYTHTGANPNELKLQNVTFTRVKDGEIYYQSGNRENHRIIGETRLELTGDTQFNTAENSFREATLSKDPSAARAKYADAVTGYLNTINSTNKPWLKDFAQLRVQEAAPRSGRLDVALTAWLAMVDKDPAAALKAKPTLEGIDAKSAYLSSAAKMLEAREKGTPKPDARRAILAMLGDIQTAMGDIDAANKTQEIRVSLGGSPEEIADVMINLARYDVANRKYDAAMERLKKVDLSVLNDARRSEGMFIMAECKGVKLSPTSPVDEWKELAIDYMKIVAGFPTSPNAGDALLKVAEIHETLKEPETALKIYQQVAREHANTPAGQAAQKSVERLGKTASRN